MKWKRSKKAQQESKHKSEPNLNDHKSNNNSLSAAGHSDQKSSNSIIESVCDKSSKIQISFSTSGTEQTSKSSKIVTTDLSVVSPKSPVSSTTSGHSASNWTGEEARHLAECARSATNSMKGSYSLTSQNNHSVVNETFYRPYVS